MKIEDSATLQQKTEITIFSSKTTKAQFFKRMLSFWTNGLEIIFQLDSISLRKVYRIQYILSNIQFSFNSVFTCWLICWNVELRLCGRNPEVLCLRLRYLFLLLIFDVQKCFVWLWGGRAYTFDTFTECQLKDIQRDGKGKGAVRSSQTNVILSRYSIDRSIEAQFDEYVNTDGILRLHRRIARFICRSNKHLVNTTLVNGMNADGGRR